MSEDTARYREASQATLALVFGILSVACLPIFGPAAWTVARDEIRGIDAGRRDPSHRKVAVVARVLGIVGSAILLMVVVVGLVALIVKGPDLLDGIMNRPIEGDLEAATFSPGN